MIIYKATNLINGKIYIGQTIQDLNQRINGHYIKCKKKSNRFHVALFKYEKNNWAWEIIETCSSHKELDKREEYWINRLKTCNKEFGYNSNPGGRGNGAYAYNPGMTNKNHTQETKEKISKAFKGKKRPQAHIDAMKKYYIDNPVRPKRIVSEETRNVLSLSKMGTKNPMYGKKSPKSGTGKNVCQYDINGSLIRIWENSNIASKELKIDRGTIDRRCKNKNNKPYKNFIWLYRD